MLQTSKTKLLRYFHTTRYLQFRQIIYRLYYHCRRPRIVPTIKLACRTWLSHWSAPRVMPSCLSMTGEFSCFGETGYLHDATVWNSSKHTKLWLYNLHYFDALNALDVEPFNPIFYVYCDTWIEHNPPMQGNGWEPYPISLRVVNWIKWFSSEGEQPREHWLDSLALQAEALMQRIEYHILGNHLFANAKALVFLGAYFSGERAEVWLKKGLRILDQEIKEQFLADGGHFELSPMYHCTLLWDVCDLINLAYTTNLAVLTTKIILWQEVVKRGLMWLSQMVHPDGTISFFNDAALGIAPTYADLLRYAAQLNIVIEPCRADDFSIQHLEATGYCVVALPYQGKAILDVARIGPNYQPGHAHADTLSFELSLHGQRFFVNSGTSTYENSTLRQFQRSTKAHNTVCINDKNSSDVWAGFRVAKRTYPRHLSIKEAQHSLSVSCAHDGYLNFPDKNVHHREWIFSAGGMTIHDVVKGKFPQAEARFYLHPGVHHIKLEHHQLSCLLPEGQLISIVIQEAAQVVIEPSFWYPSFGAPIGNQCVRIKFHGDAISTHITW